MHEKSFYSNSPCNIITMPSIHSFRKHSCALKPHFVFSSTILTKRRRKTLQACSFENVLSSCSLQNKNVYVSYRPPSGAIAWPCTHYAGCSTGNGVLRHALKAQALKCSCDAARFRFAKIWKRNMMFARTHCTKCSCGLFKFTPRKIICQLLYW